MMSPLSVGANAGTHDSDQWMNIPNAYGSLSANTYEGLRYRFLRQGLPPA